MALNKLGGKNGVNGDRLHRRPAATALRELTASDAGSEAAGHPEGLFWLTESMPVPVWGTRSDGTVSVCNAAWTSYSGLTAEQTGFLLGPSHVHPLDMDAAHAQWNSGTRDAKPFDVRCRLRRNDRVFRWHQLRAVPERGSNVLEGFWIVAGVDIHAQKCAEEERARLLEREHSAREEAEAANRMKDEFLATISHELRTPLNAILGWARMLRTGMLAPTRVQQALETIERSAQAQARLVNDILDVSRIISGKLRLQVGPIDLFTIVTEAVETVRPAAQAKGIELRWEPRSGQIPMRGDASRLQQIVWNLASNAVKFTPKGGRVQIGLEHDADYARLSVRDTGAGISADFLPYIFDRFRQGDATPSRAHEGLGLGLSIVRHLAELHGGRVAAESEGPGQGAVFTVTLPLWAGAADRKAAPEVVAFRARENRRRARPKLPRLNGATVLFVDDHPEARSLAELVFSQCGARVITAGTAEEALHSLTSFVPDVLISDIGLPDKDGYELIRSVRALPAASGGAVPAIALTAYARPEDERRAWNEGFQVHLAKPVEPDELAALVASLIAKRPRRVESADTSRRSSRP